MMTDSSTKRTALDSVRIAAMHLHLAQPGYTGYSEARFRAANIVLVRAQIAAADAGATSTEISDASEWDGVRL